MVAAISGLIGAVEAAGLGWAAASGFAVPAPGCAPAAPRPAPTTRAAMPATSPINLDFAFISEASRRAGLASALPVTQGPAQAPAYRCATWLPRGTWSARDTRTARG